MNTTLVPQQAIGQVSIKGTVFDASTYEMLFGATVTLLDDNNSAVSAPVTLDVDSNTFTIWTDQPDTRRVRIEKDGYAPTVMEFTYLMDYPEVFLNPLTADGSVPVQTTTTAKQYWWVLLLALPLLMKKKKQVGKLTQDDIKWVLLGVGGLFAFKFVRDLLARFGLVEGAGGAAVNQQMTDAGSPWKPSYWQQFSTFTYQLTAQQAQSYAETIHDAFGLFQDDFNSVLSVFSNMRTKANVSYLSDVFNQKYDEDLLSFLTNGGGLMPWDGLSDAHLKQITDLVNNLPTH